MTEVAFDDWGLIGLSCEGRTATDTERELLAGVPANGSGLAFQEISFETTARYSSIVIRPFYVNSVGDGPQSAPSKRTGCGQKAWKPC